MSQGVLLFLIPSFSSSTQLKLFVSDLDGLVLQGGSDVSPKSYGESPLKPEWEGDALRDIYEIALVQEFMAQKKPVLGVCRGAQLINVALGGTLYQDIATQIPGSKTHRNWEIYDQNFHELSIAPHSRLASLYPELRSGKFWRVNSVHHQALKDLGKGLTVEAHSEDGVIEAIRFQGSPYVFAVQWHPEFQDSKDPTLLDSRPILQEFLEEARRVCSK